MAKILLALVRGKVVPGSIVHSDYWKGYDKLVDVGYSEHFLINKSKYFTEKFVYINGIEAFWKFTKIQSGKIQCVTKF